MTGFLTVLVDPSPNVQSQDVGELEEVSVKVTVLLVAVKLATGAGGLEAVTVTVLLLVCVPMLLVTLSETV